MKGCWILPNAFSALRWSYGSPYNCFFFFLFKASLAAYWSSQASGWIRAVAVTYARACSNARSLTYWVRQGIEPASSWILVRFLTHRATMRISLVVYLIDQFSYVETFFHSRNKSHLVMVCDPFNMLQNLACQCVVAACIFIRCVFNFLLVYFFSDISDFFVCLFWPYCGKRSYSDFSAFTYIELCLWSTLQCNLVNISYMF